MSNEVQIPDHLYLTSIADLQGIITDCNRSMCQITGYNREELVGQNASILRHPGTPPQIESQLWETLRSGHPFHAPMKRHTKNGDWFWVDMTAAPIKKDGRIEGISTVYRPLRGENRAKAERLFASLAAGGNLPAQAKKFQMPISMRMHLTCGFIAFIGVFLAILGIYGMSELEKNTTTLSDEVVVPMRTVATIFRKMTENRSSIMLALQHDPNNEHSKLHNHPVAVHLDAITENAADIDKSFKEYNSIRQTEKQKEISKNFEAARNKYVAGLRQAMDEIKNNDFGTANNTLITVINPAFNEVTTHLKALTLAIEEEANEISKASEEHYQMLRNVALGALILGLLAAIIAGSRMVSTIKRSLHAAMHNCEQIAAANLSEKMDVSGRDELGELICTLTNMQNRLVCMIGSVADASTSINKRSSELETQMNQVTEQSFAQQSSVESVAAATEEFSQSVQEVAANASDAAEAAKESQELVNKSNQNINQSMEATTRVVDAVHASNKTMDLLNQSIVKIGDICSVIADIASQTNLLALNAAIEAARAGEQGRGFAVVADEVRKLAERTTASTSDINSTVGEIQEVTKEAVQSMNLAAEEVENGIGKLRESVAGLEHITKSSSHVSSMSRQISDASQQQGVASEEVASNMQRVTDLINRNAENAVSAKKATERLLGTATELNKLISLFKFN